MQTHQFMFNHLKNGLVFKIAVHSAGPTIVKSRKWSFPFCTSIFL